MRILLKTIVIGAVLGTFGCGYALLGRGTGGIDPSIKRIGVPQFKDHTGRAGLDQKITARVIEELGKRGRFEVVQDATGVDAVVEGELMSFSEVPVGFGQGTKTDARTQASRTEVRLVAKVKYSKVGATEPIWSSDSFSVSDDYNPGDDTAGLADSDQAFDRLATTFARQLVAGMLEAF
jgi:hypothetical protein